MTVDHFLQQKAVCEVLAVNRNKCHLLPTESDITTMEALKNILGPLGDFIDVLWRASSPSTAEENVINFNGICD